MVVEVDAVEGSTAEADETADACPEAGMVPSLPDLATVAEVVLGISEVVTGETCCCSPLVADGSTITGRVVEVDTLLSGTLGELEKNPHAESDRVHVNTTNIDWRLLAANWPIPSPKISAHSLQRSFRQI